MRCKNETIAIELSPADSVKTKYFIVLLNYNPPKSPEYNLDEIDVICDLEGHVFVLETKSTFYGVIKKKHGFIKQER